MGSTVGQKIGYYGVQTSTQVIPPPPPPFRERLYGIVTDLIRDLIFLKKK